MFNSIKWEPLHFFLHFIEEMRPVFFVHFVALVFFQVYPTISLILLELWKDMKSGKQAILKPKNAKQWFKSCFYRRRSKSWNIYTNCLESKKFSLLNSSIFSLQELKLIISFRTLKGQISSSCLKEFKKQKR